MPFGYRGFGKARWAGEVGYTGITITISGPANVIYTGYAPTVIFTFPAPTRVTTVLAEVWSSGESYARVSTLGTEVYRTLEDAKARVTTLLAEVWVSISDGASDDSMVSIIW